MTDYGTVKPFAQNSRGTLGVTIPKGAREELEVSDDMRFRVRIDENNHLVLEPLRLTPID